jgi:asparagine synthase (glutamine-hydrolysing)
VSGLCGWHGAASDPQAAVGSLARMADKLAVGPGETQQCLRLNVSGIAASGRDVAVSMAETSIPRRACGVVGRPRWTNAALAGEAARVGIARSFLTAYEALGVGALAKLRGAFALAVVDEGLSEVLIAVDRAGTYPMAFAAPGGGVVVFGSGIDAVVSHPGVSAEIDAQAIYDYVYFHMIPGPRSAISGVSRLHPGTYALFKPGAVEVRSYWEMRYVENEAAPFDDLKDRFIRCLRESVADAASTDSIGAFLSGGTDSSTVAGLLTAVRGEPAKTFSIGFDAPGYDEMAYARIAAKHFGTRLFEYYVTADDVVAAVPMIARAYDQPFGNASAVPTYYCARLAAAEGVTCMFGGDGGDELFGGNARYATQHLLSLYGELPEWLRTGVVEPLAFGMPGAASIPGMRKLQAYVRLASKPMPARLEHYNLLEHFGPTRVFAEEFLATIDPGGPLRQLAETYQRTDARSLINRMLALDLKYTLADNDLLKVTRMCDLAGVECAFPMLDERVMEFSAHLAPELKLKGTRLRYFFKKALGDFLPREIIAKTKHGFGLPVGLWLDKHAPLRELAMDSLADLKRRNVVQSEFLDELASVHLASHASYYGVMVWVLMMLEQWYKHHDARDASTTARVAAALDGATEPRQAPCS